MRRLCLFFVHNFLLTLFAPIFVYIFLSSTCCIVSIFSQIVERNNFIIYPCAHCIYCLCDKSLIYIASCHVKMAVTCHRSRRGYLPNVSVKVVAGVSVVCTEFGTSETKWRLILFIKQWLAFGCYRPRCVES